MRRMMRRSAGEWGPVVNRWRGSGWAGRAEQILLSAALAMLLVTAGLGASAAYLNGTALRTHLDVGLLGWMTLAVLAVALRVVSERGRKAVATVPGLGIAGALTVLAAGAVLGVSLADIALPFVVLASTATTEWSAAPDGGPAPATTAGLVQVGALVLAAAAVIAGVRKHNLALAESNIPL